MSCFALCCRRWRAAVLCLGMLMLLLGQEAAAQIATPAEQPQLPGAASANNFLPPSNATADQLVDYLAAMITFTPQDEAQAAAFQKVAPNAMNAAAKKVLQLEKDRTSDNYRFAVKYLLAVDAMTVTQATAERRAQLIEEISTQLSDPKMDSDDLDIAVTFAEGLELAGDRQLATAAYEKFSKILQQQKDAPLAQEVAQLMLGAARRLNLIGEPLRVTGLTLEGRPFDWNKYRGKVVLVDFWATWCGPCLQDLPQIKKAYDAYNAQGFEVVGISLDENRQQLEEYLGKNPVPWTTLHEGQDATNPTAMYYGISALPTTILVDRQGRVVSTAARGEELEKLLQQLLLARR